MSNGNGQSNAMVKGRNDKLQTIKGLFEKSVPTMAKALPRHLTAERLTRIALSAASRTPKLLDCTPESLLLATLLSGILGLEPNTPLGQAYLIPYGKEVQFIPGYRGLIQLAYQSGDVTVMYAEAIREKDEYEIELGTSKRLHHKPNFEEDRGDIIGFYAVAKFKHGGEDFVFMSKKQVDAIRRRSRSADNGPWVTDYEEMGKKTVIRRLSKTVPMSIEKGRNFMMAMEAQAKSEEGQTLDVMQVLDVTPEDVDPETGEVRQPATRGDALADKIGCPNGNGNGQPRMREPGEDG